MEKMIWAKLQPFSFDSFGPFHHATMVFPALVAAPRYEYLCGTDTGWPPVGAKSERRHGGAGKQVDGADGRRRRQHPF